MVVCFHVMKKRSIFLPNETCTPERGDGRRRPCDEPSHARKACILLHRGADFFYVQRSIDEDDADDGAAEKSQESRARL